MSDEDLKKQIREEITQAAERSEVSAEDVDSLFFYILRSLNEEPKDAANSSPSFFIH